MKQIIFSVSGKDILDLMMNEPLSYRIHGNFHLSMTTLTDTRK